MAYTLGFAPNHKSLEPTAPDFTLDKSLPVTANFAYQVAALYHACQHACSTTAAHIIGGMPCANTTHCSCDTHYVHAACLRALFLLLMPTSVYTTARYSQSVRASVLLLGLCSCCVSTQGLPVPERLTLQPFKWKSSVDDDIAGGSRGSKAG